MQSFFEKVADVLETDSVSGEYEFRSAPMWGSLTAFALAVMLEQNYGKVVKPGDFADLKTVSDLAKYAGVEE